MSWKNFLIFAVVFAGGIAGGKVSLEDDVRRELMKNYNKVALPAPRTVVTIRFTVLHFTLNPNLQSLDLDVWLSMEWVDPRLNWNQDVYPDIERLAFNMNSIWQPDLALYNSANDEHMSFFSASQLLVMREGKVIWVPPSHMKAACTMDMTYWPYDSHNCTIKMGSWVHSTNTMDLQIKDDFVNFEDVVVNMEGRNLSRSEWKVLDSAVIRDSKVYSCCPEEYVSIKASLLILRQAPAFAWMVQTPLIMLSLMTVVMFLLPPSAGEKVILGVVTLAIDFFFLFSVSSMIGHAPTHTPLIVQFVSRQVILTGSSLIISCIVLRLVRDPHSGGLPTFIKMPIVVMSSCLCLNGYRQMVDSSMIPITRTLKSEELELNESGGGRGLFSPDSKCGGESEWVLLAAVIDRVCLLVFVVVFFINISCYWSVL